MPQGVLATVLNGNDEGAALHANDVGMDKWGRGGGAKWTIISKIQKNITTRILIQKRIKS